jgi:type III secretory pathway lipoprotein EscJ
MIYDVNWRAVGRQVLLFCFLAGVCLSAGCGKKTVATANNEFEASLMFDVLHSNGFRVDKINSPGEAKTWDIVVDEGLFGEDEAATAILVLRDYGLPRPPEPEIKTGDSFGIVSESEERERKKRELQTQIERLLYVQPDVIRVSAIVAEPQNDVWTLDKDKTPTTATVTLVMKENQSKLTTVDVQNQVARAVPNLKPENVFVIITQQSLREIPLEKLAAQRRSNAIFAVGSGVIALLLLALGAVWMIAKKRRKVAGESSKNLTASETEDFEDAEPPLLTEDEDK